MKECFETKHKKNNIKCEHNLGELLSVLGVGLRAGTGTGAEEVQLFFFKNQKAGIEELD